MRSRANRRHEEDAECRLERAFACGTTNKPSKPPWSVVLIEKAIEIRCGCRSREKVQVGKLCWKQSSTRSRGRQGVLVNALLLAAGLAINRRHQRYGLFFRQENAYAPTAEH